MNCASTTTREWHCRGCGAIIASDHADALFCSPCQRGLSHYDPRHDDRLADDLLAQLRSHRGKPVDVYRALGLDGSDQAHRNCLMAHVRRLRRAGHQITGRLGVLTWHGQKVAA